MQQQQNFTRGYTLSKTILMAWELGNEIGHLSQFAEMAAVFKTQGHRVVIALRDLSRTHFFFKQQGLPIIQAPVWLYPVQMQRPVFCMADILMTKGYLYHTTLRNLVEAWQALLDLVQPDLVVSEYAPTLRLALRGGTTPDVIMGAGFAEPAAGQPMLDMRPRPEADGVVQAQERNLLLTINQVLDALGKPPLDRYSDLFQPDLMVMKTLPELDIYQRDATAHYCLPVSRSRRPAAQWLDRPGKKVFVYGLPEHSQWSVLIDALKACNANVFLYSPGDRRQRVKAHDEGSFRLGVDVVNVPESLRQADLFVCHGGMHNLVQAACVGVPVLSLPMNLEQLLNSLNYQALSAGVCLQKVASVAAGVQIINQMLADDGLTAAAQRLAERAGNFDQIDAIEQVVERCLGLLP